MISSYRKVGLFVVSLVAAAGASAASAAELGTVSKVDGAATALQSGDGSLNIVPVAAGSAEVTAKNGPITRVNMGDGLVDASVGDSLKQGDEVFAGADSSVTLYFAVPGCSYTVPAGTVYKVAEVAPCKVLAAADAGGTGAANGDVDSGAVLGAGVAVVGAVALVAIMTTEDDGGDESENPATAD